MASRTPLPVTGAWRVGDPVGHRQFFTYPDDRRLALDNGTVMSGIVSAYETWGQLNSDASNAILLCHAWTGDSHAAGRAEDGHVGPGWWESAVGPGRAIDTNQWFVVCANVLGGCQGSTGPASLHPEDGKPFGSRFPTITIRDMVRVQARLADHLGVGVWHSVIGGSLGGMQVLEWAVRFPEQVRAAVVLASASQLSAQGIAFNAVGRRAIYADPGFANGEYYESAGPRYGLALARMVAHITYLSENSIELKFGRRLQDSEKFAFSMQKETEFQIESYLHYQGKRFVQRFDANSYLYLTRMMDYFDLSEGFPSLEAALAQTKARFLVASYDTDWLFPTSQSRELVSALLHVRRHVSFIELRCPFGHDSFLIDIDPLAALVSPFLERTFESTSP